MRDHGADNRHIECASLNPDHAMASRQIVRNRRLAHVHWRLIMTAPLSVEP